MNTLEMLNKIHNGQKAISESLKATILKDKVKGVVVLETGKHLQLNNLVLTTRDWEIITERITDYNELFKILSSKEGVTMYVEKSNTTYWRYFNKISNTEHSDISTTDLINAKWFRGHITTSELRERGLI